MNSYTQVFGGNAIRPVDPTYLPLTFSANTTLVWPLETASNGLPVAAMIDALATTGGLSLFMPPANQGSTGVATLIGNIGSNAFQVVDNTGTSITNIAASQAFLIILTDNSTVGGVWRVYQLGATTSSANAAALAGLGLQALVTQLQTTILTRSTAANGGIVSTDRAKDVLWTGITGTLTLDLAATLTSGWWAVVTNGGTGDVTIATSGADKINGIANVILPPSNAVDQYYSCLIGCTGAGFNTLITGSPTLIPVTGGGTGADNSFDALTNLGGTDIGISIFTAPSLASILAILGIIPVTFIERTISSNQSVNAGSSASGFVCIAPLTLNLAASASLTPNFFFLVYAQGGDVTLAISGADAINGGAAGASYTFPEGTSGLVMTDAAGNWWPFFVNLPPTQDLLRVVTAGSAIPMGPNDGVLVVNKTIGSATTVTLPASPALGRAVKIKDGKGDAATNPITVVGDSGATIDGDTNYVLNFPYESEGFIFNGNEWNIV